MQIFLGPKKFDCRIIGFWDMNGQYQMTFFLKKNPNIYEFHGADPFNWNNRQVNSHITNMQERRFWLGLLRKITQLNKKHSEQTFTYFEVVIVFLSGTE